MGIDLVFQIKILFHLVFDYVSRQYFSFELIRPNNYVRATQYSYSFKFGNIFISFHFKFVFNTALIFIFVLGQFF